MTISPTQHGISFVFEQNHTFQVPRYQRGYAWGSVAVAAFLDDIRRCLRARQTGARVNHFFGGIVAVRVELSGSKRSHYEIIDGQQRLATFVLLAARLARRMASIASDLDENDKPRAKERKARNELVRMAGELRNRYIEYHDKVGMNASIEDKVTLSDCDAAFFRALISGQSAPTTRASHRRLDDAWGAIGRFVDQEIFGAQDIYSAVARINLLVDDILGQDCSVVFMSTDTRSEAYQIFQVLNDRGVHLTDGDLLRARTMELLDSASLIPMQDKVAERWDSILSYDAHEIDDYLPWYFSSFEGKRPSPSAVAEDFMRLRFKVGSRDTIGKTGAHAMLREVTSMEGCFKDLATMGTGDWPMSTAAKVLKWDEERLRMLVVQLKHTNAMPLLLALQLLGPVRFAEAVASLERFVFRYKTIGNAHAGRMTDLYLRNSKAIRASPSTYKLTTLRNEMRELLDGWVPDSVFKTNLGEVRYSARTGNGNIRYMLATLEDYRSWYESGANGVPKCKDRTRIFDLSQTTVEHIYPRSAIAGGKSEALEAVKHDLGNLTLFGAQENNGLANKSFSDKRAIMAKSGFRMNRDISGQSTWRAADVRKRTKTLVDMALKVFVP